MRQMRDELRSEFEVSFKLFTNLDGGVVHVFGDNCAQRVSLYLNGGRLHAAIVPANNGKPVTLTSQKRLRDETYPVSFRVRRDGNKLKFVLSVGKNAKTVKRITSSPFNLKYVFGGSIPAQFKCRGLDLTQGSFGGYLIQPQINKKPLRPKRVENVPTIFTKSSKEGLYLGNTEMNLETESNIENFQFTLNSYRKNSKIIKLSAQGN